MKQSESEILSILDAHKDAPMVNPNKVYPPLPPAENITPLVRIPKEMCFTKKIGGTEYIVNAHFREGGRDLLSAHGDSGTEHLWTFIQAGGRGR